VPRPTEAAARSLPAEPDQSAAIRQAAEQSGLPPDQAAKLAEVFLAAYAEMNREAEPAGGPARLAPVVEGIPVPAESTRSPVPSPAAVPGAQASSLPPSQGAVASQAVPAATSVYTVTDSQRARDARSAPAEPTVELRPPAEPGPSSEPARAAAAQSGAAGANMAAHTPAASPDQAPGTSAPAAGAADFSAGATPEDAAATWSQLVCSAVERLEDELQRDSLDREKRARLQVYLSLLHLSADNRQQAVEALKDLDEQQLEFWRQTVMGLGILLDADELPKFRHRVESAAEHLAQGANALSSLGPLRLSNLSFCSKVEGFGNFTECSAYGLERGKPVVLYVEVENFTAEPVPADTSLASWNRGAARQGAQSESAASRYVTELHGRYEILDANQRTVVSRTLPVSGDTCRKQRQDFYISYVLYMPDNIEPGDYTLELTIEDKKGNKFGNAVADFRIK